MRGNMHNSGGGGGGGGVPPPLISLIDFLDAKIHKGQRFAHMGVLDIKPFFKSTNKFQYTHFNSVSPPPPPPPPPPPQHLIFTYDHLQPLFLSCSL